MSDLAIAALFLVAYTYAGYPILIAGLALLVARPVRARNQHEPSVSFCIAVCDGARFLERKIQSIGALDYPADKIEILICSDGSVDGTDELAARLAALDPRIRILENCGRHGKPRAVNSMRAAARGEILILTDVRQPLAPNALKELIHPLADASIGCVSGNLVLTGASGAGAYWNYEKVIRRAEGRLGTMVGVSGSIYAVRRAELPVLPEDVILDDMYVPLSIALSGKRVVFCEAAEAYDEAFDDEREFGRKVRTLAGNFQLLAKMPKLLVPGLNRSWFQLVSHKLLRLACPWALGLVLVASGLLAVDARIPEHSRMFWQTLFLGQIGFYTLAALGARAGRLAALARTFVVLNAAAVVGLWRFARGTQRVTW